MKSKNDSAGSKRESEFSWFGLPTLAEDSRGAALGGMALTLLITTGCYFLVVVLSAVRGVTVFDPEQLFVVGGRSLDSRIPYLPWTVVIYKWYVLFFLLPVLTYPKTESGARELFRLYSGLVKITLAACVVFILCPAELTLRVVADHQGGSKFLHQGILAPLRLDPPFNTWPSMHVALPGLVTLVVTRWLERRRWVFLLWVCSIAMSISTLTIKQHFIWDVITGALLALVYWQWKLRKPAIGGH